LVDHIRHLKCVTATERAMRVAIVEKHWHDSLLSRVAPRSIDTVSLFANDRLRPNIVQDRGFAVIDLVRIFGHARPVVRHFVLHSSTRRQEAHAPHRLRRQHSEEGGWKFGDIKRQFCSVLFSASLAGRLGLLL
jgi:hypothetical protein